MCGPLGSSVQPRANLRLSVQCQLSAKISRRILSAKMCTLILAQPIFTSSETAVCETSARAYPSPMSTILVIAIIVCAVIGARIGDRKGHPWAGLLLGGLLGVLGIIAIALVPTSKKQMLRNEVERQRIEDEAREQRLNEPGAPPKS